MLVAENSHLKVKIIKEMVSIRMQSFEISTREVKGSVQNPQICPQEFILVSHVTVWVKVYFSNVILFQFQKHNELPDARVSAFTKLFPKMFTLQDKIQISKSDQVIRYAISVMFCSVSADASEDWSGKVFLYHLQTNVTLAFCYKK